MYKTVGICIDNQERVQYHVDYISDALGYFDRIYWFVPDKYQASILEDYRDNSINREKINIFINGIKITKPNHIADAQNYAIGYLRNISDVACIMRADMWPSPLAIELLDKWVNNEIYDDFNSVTIKGMMVKVFCETWPEPYVLTAVRGDGVYEACSDGGVERGVDPINGGFDANDGKDRECYDLGYIGITQFYRKVKSHAQIWGMDVEKSRLIKLYESGDMVATARQMLRDTVNACRRPVEIVPPDGFYGKIIKDLKLMDEYEIVKKIIDENTI